MAGRGTCVAATAGETTETVSTSAASTTNPASTRRQILTPAVARTRPPPISSRPATSSTAVAALTMKGPSLTR